MMKSSSPCNSLCKTTPISYMAWATFEKCSNLAKTRIYRGHFVKLVKLQIMEGPITKMHITMGISSSNYPRIIYGKPLFEKVLKTRFEFELKFKFEFKQKRKRK